MDTVVIGLDVGKTAHYAHVIDDTGTRLFHRAVPQEEPALRTLFADAARHGDPVLVLDQSASIGALPRAIAHELKVPVLYLPGSTFHHVANSFPGRTKTDRRDAEIIATAGRTMPHAVRALTPPCVEVAEMKAVPGHLADLTDDIRRDKTRLRSVLSQMHAPLERLLGSRLGQAGILPMLTRWPTPDALRAVADTELIVFLKSHDSRRAAALVDQIRTALGQQLLVLPGSTRVGIAVAYRAAQCAELIAEKRRASAALETQLAANATARLIGTMTGFGTVTIATVLIALDGKTFPSADHLAAYAGVAPTVHQSGASRQVRRTRTANTRLKNAMCWAAFNAIRSGWGKRIYEDKRDKGHWKAIIALARKRTAMLYAMLRDGTSYREPTPPPALTRT